MNADRSELVRQFVASFSRAIGSEMDAMRARLGPFEVSLEGGRLVQSDAARERFDLRYQVAAPNDKLVAGMECSLVVGEVEQLVTVTELDERAVELRAGRTVPTDVLARLVIYPWFLYDRLRQLLEAMDARRFHCETAFRLFNKLPASRVPVALRLDHSSLDSSQRAAVELSTGADVAFVWGPPGTGKTSTLSHIVAELVGQGRRVLVASTTNAALDQALDHLVRRAEMRALVEVGHAVRIGRTDADTHGAALSEVVARLGEHERRALDEAKRREHAVKVALGRIDEALRRLSEPDASQQSLFGDPRENASVRVEWHLLGTRRATAWRRQAWAAQITLVSRRHTRLGRLAVLCRARTERLATVAGSVAQRVVSGARLVLATLTNTYFSPLLAAERFDVLVVDEAAMAILPSVFYAACLARSAAIMVGDPRQLPSIVQSDDPYVRRAMGRNVFEIGTAGEERRPFVAMLRTQYRMHPVIGELVSTLFYGSELTHAAPAAEVDSIAAAAPYPGSPLVLVDMVGRGSVRADAGGSRVNEASAELCAALARQAVGAGITSVAVITPYVAQARTIRERLGREMRSSVECSTVHRFQGHERDLVILDTVDAEPMRPGVLLTAGSAAENLLNVSLSRARGKVIVVADRRYFSDSAPRSPVARVVEAVARAGVVVRADTVLSPESESRR